MQEKGRVFFIYMGGNTVLYFIFVGNCDEFIKHIGNAQTMLISNNIYLMKEILIFFLIDLIILIE